MFYLEITKPTMQIHFCTVSNYYIFIVSIVCIIIVFIYLLYYCVFYIQTMSIACICKSCN